MKKLLILFFAFISILSFGQTRLTYDTVKLQYIKGKIAHVIYIGDTLIFPMVPNKYLLVEPVP